MSRTTYWTLLLISAVSATVVWSGPERWRAITQHPHVAAVLDHFEIAHAQAQAPPTTPAAYDPRGAAPEYQSAQSQFQQPPYAPVQSRAAPPQPQSEAIEGAQVIATVGDLLILAEEVIGPINQTLAQYEGKISPEQYEQTRRALIDKSIKQLIPTKLLYGEYLVTVPPEGQAQVTKSLAERFVQDRLPEMMKKAGVSSRLELDGKFREYGTSLERQRQQFIESSISSQWMQQNLEYEKDVTYDQMLAYYRSNLSEYEVKAKVRWVQLSINFDKAASDAEAQAQIVKFGNMLWHGAKFEDVARQHSHDIKADEGGKHDWITRGALASQEIEDALFALPVGQLSRIIRDDRGLHIVKVLERVEDGTTPFTEAQGEIKQSIVKKRRKDAIDAYLSRLRDKTDIWTIFDDAPVSEISQAAGSTQR